MTSASSLLSEDQFLCSICMDMFTDPVTTPCGHNYCKACITQHWDTNDACKCPFCNKTFYRRPEVCLNTFISGLVDQTKKSLQLEEERKKAELRKTEAEVQQMIQERQVKIQEIKHSVELRRKYADTVIADGVQVFSALIHCIERSQLKKRRSELKQLSHTEDHLHLRLEKTLSPEMKRLCDAELRRFQQYAVDVTLDPDTAHPWLVLSEDGKQVSDGNIRNQLPDNTKRFSIYPIVLGKQGFSAGRFYYEVEVKGKTEWTLGVARESINRKGKSKLSSNNGYWTMGLRYGNEYRAAPGPDGLLPVRVEVQKVGMFVDYEEGLVSFYDVETRVHLCSFTGCTFTEKLFPYFCPRHHYNGKNSAPLIISPINHID